MARMARDAGTWPDEQQEPAGAGRSRAVPWVATATGVVLLILAPRYGPHRDELYFVVAGHHPQRGYPDQPPLTPLLAAFLHDLAPGSLVALRSVSALLVVLVVWLAADLARAFGASRHGQLLSAVVVAVGPGVLSVGHLLSTSTLDLAVWVGVTRLAVAALGSGDRRWWLAAGLLLGVGLENKTLPAFLALGLVVGLAGSPRFRGHLASPWLWAAALVAVALWAPNLHWQATHGWPQLELGADIRAEDGGLLGAVTLVGFQLLLLGPIGGYLAVRGLGVGLRNRTGLVAPVATAYVVVLAVLLATGGKHYYTLGLLVALAAAGAARSSPALPAPAPGRPRSSWFVWIAAIAGLVPLPSALPVLPAPVYAATPWAAINDDQLNTIGWPTVVAQVRDVVDQQPAGVVVLSQNYGEAGAWSWFTGRPAWSGHNGYADWGPPPESSGPVVLLGDREPDPDLWDGCRLAATLDPGVDNEEFGARVWVCAGPVGSWSRVWPRQRHLST